MILLFDSIRKLSKAIGSRITTAIDGNRRQTSAITKSIAIGSIRLLSVVFALSASAAIETAPNWTESGLPIRFKSRDWADAVLAAASTNSSIAIEGGRLLANTTWDATKTHLVFNTVYIPSGITLTISEGTIVKFCPGTMIKVEDGGKLNIVGASGNDVILTAANDATVGEVIAGLGDEPIAFDGIRLQSSGATFTDNSHLETRGFNYGAFPTVSVLGTEAVRNGGVAYVPFTLSGSSRETAFSIEWEAIEGTAKYGDDYTLASGTISWGKSSEGTKTLQIPINAANVTGEERTFTVRVKAARGSNIGTRTATVTIVERDALTLEWAGDWTESEPPIRFKSRDWADAVLAAASTNSSIAIEGGRLLTNTTWDSSKTHLVFNTVYVPSGITLTISEGAVVKFCPGTTIKVEDGGKLNIVGSSGNDVILTAANDATVGEVIAGLGEESFAFGGIRLQSTAATFTDNGWLETRGFNYAAYPSVTLNDSTAFRSSGLASIPVTISGTRDQTLTIDWVAEDGTAKYGEDYTVASGRITWGKASEGTKTISIPLVTSHIVGATTSFKIKIVTARGANIADGECTVSIREFNTLNIESGSAESTPPIRFKSRDWADAVLAAASTNDAIAIEGGRLLTNTTWDATKTHLVFNTVYVPSGITLTISEGAVVKFCPGTMIKVEDGGKLNIVGASGNDVILTAANDATVGEAIAGLGGEPIVFGGIRLQSTAATFTDNGWLEMRGFNYGAYPNVTLHDATANRKTGMVYLPVTVGGTTRNQSFTVDWVAEDGSAQFGRDYATHNSGRLTWSKSGDGTKYITIPLVTTENAGSNRTFKVRFVVARGVNVTDGEATVTISEFAFDGLNGQPIEITTNAVSSTEFAIKESIGSQPIFLNDIEQVRYSGKWQTYDKNEAAALRVTVDSDNGTKVLKECSVTETGSFELRQSDYATGFYTLKHEILNNLGETLATKKKSFSIIDTEDVELHGGILTKSETWSADKIHVVYETVTVPAAYTLFIEPGAIVKFMTGTGIDISQGGALFANKIIFTHINDDTIGGDTLSDGYTVAPPMDAYTLSGNFTFGDDTELRGITQNNALTGTISTRKVLSRGSTYRVSGTLTIANGGSLTIPPGTVLKMESGASIVVNSGATLTAVGTRAAPIIITSIKDDSVSGDTNGDGDKTIPQPGDWNMIKCSGGMINMEHASVLYGGKAGNNGGDVFYLNGGEMVFNESVMAHAFMYGVALENGSWAMTNSVFQDFHTAFRHFAQCDCVNSVFYDMTYLSNNGGQNFKNCIIADFATALCWWTDNCTYQNCVIWNSEGFGPQDSEKTGKNGNIWGDPLFVDPDNGDFRIEEGSPCVDAADSSIAPEFDYYGQPRITVTEQGTNTVGQLADIGICEVMPRNVTSDIDLVPQNVRTVTNAVPGELLFVKWEVKNAGGRELEGAWRDTVSLVSNNGREVQLGVKTTSGVIAPGGSIFCSGYFTIPPISEGEWYPKVNVNSYRDVFEGALGVNNALVGDRALTVKAEALDPSVAREGVIGSGTPSVIKLTFGADDENRMVKFDVPAGVKVTWGFGFMPQGSSQSGAMTATDGGVMFRVPEGATDVYVVLESDKTATYEMTTESTKMVITGVTPNRISNNAQTTIVVSGAGFSDVKEIRLRGDGKTYTPMEYYIHSDTEISAVFKAQDWSVGEYVLSIVGGNKSIDYPVSVFSTSVEPKLVISVDKPSAVRAGRWYTVKVTCRNEGDADVFVPIVTLHGPSEIFRDPDDGISEQLGSMRLIFLSKKGNPFVLRAGQEESITVEFKTTAISDNCTLAVQPFIKGINKVSWENIFTSSSDDESLLKKAKAFYGDTTDLYFEEVFRRIEMCTDLGYYPKCVDEYYESSFLLKNSKLLLGSINDKKDEQPLVDGILRVLVPGKGTRYGKINSNGSFFVYGFDKDELDMAKYTLVNNYNPVQVVDLVSCSNSVQVVLSAQMESMIVPEQDVIEVTRSASGIQKSVLFLEDGKTLIAILTIDGDIYIADVSGDGVLKTEYVFSKSRVERFVDFYLAEGLNGNKILIAELRGTDGSDKLYKYELSKGLSVNSMVCNQQEQYRSKFFFSHNDRVGALYATDECLKLCLEYDFVEDVPTRKVQYKAYKPGDYYDWNFSFDVPGVEIDGSAHISTVVDHRGCCLWNMRGACEVVGGCKFGPLPRLFIPLSVTTDMNITCDRKEQCSREAEIILDGVDTVSGGVGISMEIGESILRKIDVAIANAVYAELKIPSSISKYARPFHSSLSVGANLMLTKTQNIGYGGAKISQDWDLGLYGTANYNIGLGMEVNIGDRVSGSLTTTFGDVSLNYGVSVGTSGIKVWDGSIEVQWAGMRGSAPFRFNPILRTLKIGSFEWGHISGVHNRMQKNRNALALSTLRDETNIVLDYSDYYGDYEMKIRHPIWVNSENGGVALWEKDCTDGSNVWKSIKAMCYDSTSKSFGTTFDIIESKNILSKNAIAIDENLWMSVISTKDSDMGGELWSVLFSGSTFVSSEKICNVSGVVSKIALEKGCDGQLKLGYVRISQDGFLLCYREYANNRWGDEVVIDSSEDGGFDNLSMSKVNDKFHMSYSVEGRHFLVRSDFKKFEIVSDILHNEEEGFISKTAVEDDSVRKFNILLLSSTRSSDGCDDDCNCGCGFRYSCGCPENCPCAGNCKDDDQCCDCKDIYGMPIHKSVDPNEMAGPLGLGNADTERFVKPGEWMTYTVYFENMTNATAAAQEVYVTNPLSEWLDWSTFEMGEVSFGNQIDLGLSGKSSGTTEKRMDGTNWIVRTELSIEPDATALDSNRQQKMCAKWYLRIVDPTTSTGWPVDPVAGFLPPNNLETHCGEGHLTYRIKLRDDAPSGLVITNSATIVFDYNEPITTDPAWWNTVAPETIAAKMSPEATKANEGDNLTFKVFGGNLTKQSSVQVQLAYNTASAADIDLKNGTVDRSTDGSPVPNAQAARSTNLKFPLTLTWAAGEIGEKTITIPVLADKAVEADEFFTLQLASPMNMELGKDDVCTVTIHDISYDELKAKIDGGTATAKEVTQWNKLHPGKVYVRPLATPATGGKVSGGAAVVPGKTARLRASALSGYVFAGWYTNAMCAAGQELVGYGDYRNPSLAYLADELDVDIFARFIPVEEDYLTLGDNFLPSEITTNAQVSIYVPVESASLPDIKVSGLPSGLKFYAKETVVKATKTTPAYTIAANTIYGIAPKRATTGPATVTVTVKNAGKYAITRKYQLSIIEGEAGGDSAEVVSDALKFYSLAVDLSDDFAGKVTGPGVYQAGKKVTVKATANKGYVFNGWYYSGTDVSPEAEGRAAKQSLEVCSAVEENAQAARSTMGEELLTQAASYSFTMPETDVALYAKFVTAEEDAASIALSVDALGGEISPEAFISVTNTCGVALKWSVAADALSQPVVAVTGLPSGLKFTAKDIMKKGSKTEIDIPANTIYGAPTAESKLDAKTGLRKPSAVKFTVTTAGKSKRIYPVDMTVLPLPDWAVGTFNGGGDFGQVSLTVAKTGKLSGKYLSEGLTWTLAANSFDSIDDWDDAYRATLIGKSGKLAITNEICIVQDGMGGFAESIDYIAYQNNWKLEPWKTVGKSFAKAAALEYEDFASVEGVDAPGVLSLKFAASGAVTVKGSFVTGVNEKTGKEILYSASGTAVLVPFWEPDESGEFYGDVFVYLPPKAGKFDGYVCCVHVIWTGDGWILE